jgi:GAF domain-containing protein/anti-sigma regulatory factor (Ser/Thr protein kinase)
LAARSDGRGGELASLRHQLAESRHGLKEAREQQAATSEILRVIAGTVADVKLVLAKIAEHAMRLCQSVDARIWLAEGDRQQYVTGCGPLAFEPEGNTLPLDRTSGSGRAIIDRKTVHIPDAAKLPAAEFSLARELQRRHGHRTVLNVPLLLERRALGALTLRRLEVEPFTPRQIELVETFADQAVIAIENARLFTETKEALQQQTATSEILRVISSSPTDVQPVFDSIARSAMRLCEGSLSVVSRYDGEFVHLAAQAHASAEGVEVMRKIFPMRPGRQGIHGRVVLEGGVVHIPDAQADQEYSQPLSHALHLRSGLGVPMLRDGRVVGAVSVGRVEIRPFNDKEIALLKTFADQAVIAIENVRLFKELQARNAEVTEALEQRTATSEILQVISESPTDVAPVFDAITRRAAQLCDARDARLFVVEGNLLRNVAGFGEFATTFATRPLTRGLPMGRAIIDRSVVHVEDLAAALDDFPDSRETQPRYGNRTTLAVPLLRENRGLGAILMRRKEVRPFTPKQIELVKTFADQAVIAIENVRLFKELQARNAEVTEALEQQTATAEILKVISSSPTDTQPVFNAIVTSCSRLFGGVDTALRLIVGDHAENVANTMPVDDTSGPGGVFPVPLDDPSFPTPRAMLRREVVQIPDVSALDDWCNPRIMERARSRGWRAILVAPLLRESTAIGVITVNRATPGPFSDKQIALLKTFADQAVIAIENVRLFNETREALEQQKVISEILRVISASPTDTQPVFEAIVKSGLRLFTGQAVALRLLKGDRLELAASTYLSDAGHEFSLPLDGQSATSRAILRREVIQIPDVLTEDWVGEPVKEQARRRGYRATMVAPMMREDKMIGTIAINRAAPGFYTEKEVALARTFADQAVIAIENVRLFKELQARNAEVTEALEQQTATSEILRVISSTPADVMPVLDAVAHRAAQLCDAPDARILLVEGENLRYVTGFGALEGALPLTPLTRGRVSGRAVLDRSIVQVEDLAAVPEDYPDLSEAQRAFGTRTALAVPLLKEGKAFGAILLRRKDVRPFTEQQIALVKTFADQAAIGIENVRLFNEIQDKSRQLEVANKHKSDFLANMSHELRTPLNAIIGFSEALGARMFGELNPKQDEYIHDIHSSGQHLLSLINDILDLSKVEAGRMELELSDFDLPAALGNAISLVRERAQNHGIALKLDVDPDLGKIRADERKVKQIVLNLLSNAVKFTPDGGRVEVSAHANGETIEVSVADTGIGIAPEDQEAVFEEFRQVGRDYTRKQEGTGLGLALTRRFVELHGGTIRLESEPGKGSTFSFTLPLSRQA